MRLRTRRKFQYAMSKTVLAILLIITGIIVIILTKGSHLILGAIAITFFILIFSTFIERNKLEKWLDRKVNGGHK